jgi:rare lipoprotein A
VGQVSNCVFSSRFARGYRAATLITACLVGAAVNEGQAATRSDLVETSLPSVRVPASTVFTTRLGCSQNSLVVNIRAGAAWQAPASGLAQLPFASRFTRASDPIEGMASAYNPGDSSDRHSGGYSMASGEKYDPEDWSAAIRTDLRDKFGKVAFGKDYRSIYALVESADKRVIVKINDVGPLRPGRIIDLNIRAMRYFDPTLKLGLIKNVKVTPLVGSDIAPGPVENDPPTNFAGWFV